MKLLVGLCNPGERYNGTRHNAGKIILSYIVSTYAENQLKSCRFGEIFKFKIFNKEFIGLYPNSYINLSGEAVQKCMSFYKISADDIIVLHDDIDLTTGRIKTKVAGSSGGHNGIKSIDRHIGVHYRRIRVGIGRPEYKSAVSNYVLQKFSAEESELLLQSIPEVLEILKEKV